MSISLKQNVTLDVVVIGRNEGELLKDALKSAIEASKYFQESGYPYPEIVYVDGQSSDKSVEIAKNLGIKTLVVLNTPTPAKGRHFGFFAGKSKYCFFLDGDTVVDKEWFVKGVEYLEQNPKVAGVGGILDWEEWCNGKIINKKQNYWDTRYNGQKVIDGVGGNFLYRRDILEKAGDFNPNLPVSEEFELRLRIAKTGYDLVRIVIPMAVHRDAKSISFTTFLQRSIFNKNIFISGIITRKAPKTLPVLKLLFYRYWLYLIHPLMVLYILIAFILFFQNYLKIWLISGMVMILFLFFAHYFYKGRNFQRAMVSIITVNFYSFGWFFGLLTNYPKFEGFNDKKF